jgi:hypothetical protein
MAVRRIRYKEDPPGRTAPLPGSPYLPFGAFAVSPRMQGLVTKVTSDMAVFARSISPESADEGREGKPRYKDSFKVTVGEIVKIKGLKRVTANLGNTAPHAAAVEFGSGEGSLGDSSESGRPQGGSNAPMRILGKTARAFGDWRE